MKRTQKINPTGDLVFQLLSWNALDLEYGDDSADDEDGTNYDETKYLVKVYGCTEEGNSVSLNILNFTPFFYIKVDHNFNARFTQELHTYIVSKLPWNLKKSLVNVKILKRKDFWGFTNLKQFSYARITFKNLKGFKSGIRIFNSDVKIPGVHTRPVRYKLYESNIDPFLRLMHIRELDPSGWCKIPGGKYSANSGVYASNCQIDVECDWKNISPYECEKIAPFVIASFDIECTSSHGDFPVAKKDYKKVANELVNWFYENKEITLDALKTTVQSELSAIFTPTGGNFLSKVYTKQTPLISTIDTIITRHLDDIVNILTGNVVYKGEKKITREYIVNCLTKKFGTFEATIGVDRQEVETWKGIFPPLEGDNIIQIGTTVHLYGEKQCSFKNIITLGSCDPIDGVEVIPCETEEELLLKWRDLIIRLDPDVMMGYNIFGFDMSYMADRAKERGVLGPFLKCGRIKGQECKYEKKMLSSSALGDNILRYIDIDGRVLIDIMKVIQRDHKLDSFKLDNVAHHFMGMNKNDVHPNDIFRLQKGTSADRKVIAEYCVQDCALCNHLTMKLEILANNIGMSNVCSVPLSFIFMRGQGIKIFSLVAKECRNEDFLIPTMSRPWGEKLESADDDGYEGAIVLEPKTGIYIDEPICVVDYASLYPSSMISENLSHDCIVMDPKYDNLPDIQYLDISYDIYEGTGDKKQKVGEKVCRFVQNEKGIIPRILQKLLRKRKETRKKAEWKTVICSNGRSHKGIVDDSNPNTVKVLGGDGSITEVAVEDIVSIDETYDDFQKAVLDGLQLAYKVTANSLYGQIGARTSQIYMKEIAACTTATGRKMIMLAKDYIEKNNEAEIVYGDSVVSYTPCVILVDKQIRIETIENIPRKYGGDKWITCSDEEKQGCEINGVKVWSDNGWTDIKRVIRHELSENKKIVRVNTHCGVVDVTDDHSLLDKNGVCVTPKNTKIGDELMHRNVEFRNNVIAHHSIDEARIMGMFMGDGSCGYYKKCNKTSWAINNSLLPILTMYKQLCEKVYPQFEWKILDTLESSGVYKLVPCSGKSRYGVLKEFIINYRNLTYDGKNKIVPSTILMSDLKVRSAFWEGLCDADGDKDINKYTRIDQKSQISAASIALLAQSLGYCVSLNTRIDKPNIYRITCTKGGFRRNSSAIKKMYNIDYKGYVYDLTTQNHHFQAGVGSMIVHNTDSLFIKFYTKDELGNKLKGKDAIPKVRELGIKNSKEIKKILKPPHDLEWEKIFYPFVLLSKKRYVANKYEWDDHKCKQNSMGIVLKRRDNANIVKKIYGGIIDIILNEQDVQKSIDFLSSSLNDLIAGKYPLEDLVITKSLRSDYKDPEKIAHKMLADRIKERDPGNAPNVNDRIPFVYVKTKEKPKGEKTLQGERIETPDYIRNKNLQPDYEFYITNQIMNPVLQVYALVLDQLPGYEKNTQYWSEMYDKVLESKDKDVKKTNTRIDDLKEAEVKRLLFDPVLHKIQPPKPPRGSKKAAVGSIVIAPPPSENEPLPFIMPPPKRGRKPKVVAEKQPSPIPQAAPLDKPKRGRKKVIE